MPSDRYALDAQYRRISNPAQAPRVRQNFPDLIGLNQS